jgi:hypothetical protein
MQTKLGGKVPVTFALKGILVEDSTQFKVLDAKMGHLSLPKFAQSKVIEKFLPGTDSGVIKKILDNSKDFKVENGDFIIDLKPQK